MVTITTLTNGLIFDASAIPGIGVSSPSKIFMPKAFPGIHSVSLYDNRIVVQDTAGVQFELSVDGVNNSYPISDIDGTLFTIGVSTPSQLFNKIITIF